MKDFNDILKLKKAYAGKMRELEIETNKLGGLYKDLAEKECLYREAKAKTYLSLLADDNKVTVIPTLANGKTAEVRLLFKVSDGILRATKENIKRIHANISAYQTLISIAKAEILIR